MSCETARRLKQQTCFGLSSFFFFNFPQKRFRSLIEESWEMTHPSSFRPGRGETTTTKTTTEQQNPFSNQNFNPFAVWLPAGRLQEQPCAACVPAAASPPSTRGAAGCAPARLLDVLLPGEEPSRSRRTSCFPSTHGFAPLRWASQCCGAGELRPLPQTCPGKRRRGGFRICLKLSGRRAQE